MNLSWRILFGGVAVLLTIMAGGAYALPTFGGAANPGGCRNCHTSPDGSFNVLPSNLIEIMAGSMGDVTFDVTDLGNVSEGDASLAVWGLNDPNLMATPDLTGWAQRSDGKSVYISPFFNTLGQHVLGLTIGAGATLGDYPIVAMLAGGLSDWSSERRDFTIRVTAPGVTGDYNGNGIVDAADYAVWRDGLGTTYTQADYDVWRAHFGQTAASGALLNSAVPEPATLAMLLVGMLAMIFWLARPRTPPGNRS